MGAEEVPVPLKYALSSTKSPACEEDSNECLDGEGNMFLHGGVSVEGDVKIDGDLIVSDMAYTPARAENYLIKEVYWLESVLPELEDTELELGGEIYKYNVPQYLRKHSALQSKYNEKINAYNAHIARKDFTSSEYEQLSNINEAFYNNKGPIIEEKIVSQEDVDIDNAIEQMKYTNKESGVVEINSAAFKLFEGHRTFKNINNQNKLYGFYCAKGLIFECALNLDRTYSGKFYLVGNNNNLHRFAIRQDLHIGRELFDIFNEPIKVNIHDKNDELGGIYVGRNLTIGRGLTSDLEAATKDPNIIVEIDGNMYVNGDLHISGVEGKFNSIIYVNGDVTIERSKISGLNKDGKEGRLIIFANGKIDFVKNQLFRNNYNTLEGFFYSKEKIEVFGSASNFKIKGGISAPKIVLNGIRGRAGIGGLLGVIKPFSPSQKYVFGYYETKENQFGKQSRLQVEYDSSILETYSNLSIDDHV